MSGRSTNVAFWSKFMVAAFALSLLATLASAFFGFWSVASELSPVALITGICAAIGSDLAERC